MTDEPPRAAPERVLVVEDEPEIQYLLSRILADEGREVVLAATAREAGEILERDRVHLVVLDLVLPDADGRVLLRDLRTRLPTANVPVIVLTGRAGPGLREESFDLGADAFVTKPFRPDALAADVASRLERARRSGLPDGEDRLTGLLNLAGLLEAMRVGGPDPRGLVVAELDGLATVRERYGWATAAMAAGEVGKALKSELGAGTAARTAEGQCAALVESGSREAVAEVAHRILGTVRKTPVTDHEGETFRVTASVGFVTAALDSDPYSVLEAARIPMHRARQEGGNRVWAPDAGEAASGQKPLILVAEDDDITAKILTHRLERDSFDVLRFDNGQDAYRAALGHTPALVVLDVKMPGMDGFEVLSRLRKTPAYADIPVMMLTSMGSEADVVRGLDLGADDYMLKPFSPTELLARIRRLIRRGGGTAD